MKRDQPTDGLKVRGVDVEGIREAELVGWGGKEKEQWLQ